MKNKTHPPTILSILTVHQLLKLKKPTNPLVSVINLSTINIDIDEVERRLAYNFFSIALKKNCDGFGYGQHHYDFDEGVMSFVAPQQVISHTCQRLDGKCIIFRSFHACSTRPVR